MREITRRSAIGGALIAPAAMLGCASASPARSAETAVAALWARRAILVTEVDDLAEADDMATAIAPASDHARQANTAYVEAWERLQRIEDAILQAPSTSMSDLHFKAEVCRDRLAVSDWPYDDVVALFDDIATLAAR